MALNYTDIDWETIVLNLRNRLKLRDSWKDVGASGTGETLIELFAYILTNGNYYTERRATESYLPTARLLSSVKNLVALIGYSPKRKTSAVGTLTFSIVAPLTKNVYIPKNTSCGSSIKYLTSEDSVIEKGQLSVTSNAIQGEVAQLEISSNGVANQEYLINSTEVENSANTINPTLKIVVNGVLWTKVDSFISSDGESTNYRIINEMDGTVTVVFGDGVNGVIPVIGESIVISYVKSSGLSGNVVNTGMIITINSTIYDEDGVAVTTTVTNNSSFLGGDDAEDIEEIRYEAPRVFKTGQRAVNKEDFIAILENYPGIANVNVWGEKEEADALGVQSLVAMRGIAKICMILQEWGIADSAFKALLSEYLHTNFAELTVRYQFITPTILDVIPVIDLKVSTGYSMSQAQSNAEAAIADQFILGDTVRLGEMVRYSRIVAAVDDLEDIAYINMILEIRKELDDDYNSAYDYGEILDAIPIKPGTSRLFMDDLYVLTDVDDGDGTGTFTGSGITGSINYTTGEVLLNVGSPPILNIYFRYCQDQDNNIITNFEQIAELYDVDVNSIAME